MNALNPIDLSIAFKSTRSLPVSVTIEPINLGTIDEGDAGPKGIQIVAKVRDSFADIEVLGRFLVALDENGECKISTEVRTNHPATLNIDGLSSLANVSRCAKRHFLEIEMSLIFSFERSVTGETAQVLSSMFRDEFTWRNSDLAPAVVVAAVGLMPNKTRDVLDWSFNRDGKTPEVLKHLSKEPENDPINAVLTELARYCGEIADSYSAKAYATQLAA